MSRDQLAWSDDDTNHLDDVVDDTTNDGCDDPRASTRSLSGMVNWCSRQARGLTMTSSALLKVVEAEVGSTAGEGGDVNGVSYAEVHVDVSNDVNDGKMTVYEFDRSLMCH